MKVLLAHNNYRVQGGAEVFYHEVGRVLSEQGHEVACFSAMDEKASTTWSTYFPPVTRYNQGSLATKAIGFPSMVYSRAAKAAMERLIQDFKPDIIHAFAIYIQLTPSILDAARQAGVPVVMSCNDYKHICPSYKLFHHGHLCEDCNGGQFYHAALNRCSHNSMAYSVASAVEAYVHQALNIYRKNVHTFLFASEFMAHKTEQFWGSETFRWKMLRNPFDAAQYCAESSLGGYALYFGRLIDEKGVNVLLDAAALTPEIPVMIVGDGPELPALQAQAERLKLDNVKFLGAKWGAELNTVLQGCRFVVVPSLWHENFPYVILQAFAMGKPVVGSNRGGIPELVEHGQRGLIYEATNPEALAAAMLELMQDETKTWKMGEEAKRYANAEFNDAHFYERLMQIYNEVLV